MRIRHFIFALLILVAANLSPPKAQAVEYKDILGAWCSATAQLTFSRTTMKVKWFSDNQTAEYKITKFEFQPTTVEIYWINFENKEVSAVYGDFAANGSYMFLQQNPNAPRRQYKRC